MPAVKRGRTVESDTTTTKRKDHRAKKSKVELSFTDFADVISEPAAIALFCGTNDIGQAGLDKDETPRSTKPRRTDAFTSLGPFIQVVCTQHTLLLTALGEVYSVGLNENSQLGYPSAQSEDRFEPFHVELESKCVMVAAGDCFSAFLVDSGKVFACGSFRNLEGRSSSLGEHATVVYDPIALKDSKAVKIVAGAHHLAILLADGHVYTLGLNTETQLGRLPRRVITRQNHGRAVEVTCLPVALGRSLYVKNVWCLSYGTIIQLTSGKIYVTGQNLRGQLGLDPLVFEKVERLTVSEAYSNLAVAGIRKICGEHHALVLTDGGMVKAIGRGDDGRLGIPEEDDCVNGFVDIQFGDQKIKDISSNIATSYAVTESGTVYAWGYNSDDGVLGLGPNKKDTVVVPPEVITSKHLDGFSVVAVTAAAQSAGFLAKKCEINS